MENYKKLAKKFNALSNDQERLAFLKKHSEKMKVVIDAAETMVAFIDGPEDAPALNSFDDYHGDNFGVLYLFVFAGIAAELA